MRQIFLAFGQKTSGFLHNTATASLFQVKAYIAWAQLRMTAWAREGDISSFFPYPIPTQALAALQQTPTPIDTGKESSFRHALLTIAPMFQCTSPVRSLEMLRKVWPIGHFYTIWRQSLHGIAAKIPLIHQTFCCSFKLQPLISELDCAMGGRTPYFYPR